ncbi:MAG: family oxidoreductase [Bacteroidota bacterium]|jgi:NAD(P)-dependent dehydrogenase (short-subunit alcohol dehydrogenase family)|nr:family oxidoreductase [Bacteroidota bacterium]
MFTLADKTILITGASSGIGRATAILFSERGANVIITGRNELALNETYLQLNPLNQNQKIVADLTNPKEVKSLVGSLHAEVDGFVHCCGKVLPVPVKYIKREQLEDVFSVNYFSAVNCVSELLLQKKINKNSSIVFISSVSTLHAYFGGGPYISSKAALEGYAKTLALELAPKKIRVNVVLPALVNTAIFDSTVEAAIDDEKMNEMVSKYPFGIGEPLDVAQALAFFISDNSKWITGSFLKMDGGLTLGLS